MAILDVIKYEGANDTLVWKHPQEDFNNSSQLIVHETQEAMLYKDGRAVELYRPGRHTISTANLPFLTRMSTLITGGIVANHYEVYFINKAYIMNIDWGTSKPMQIQDPIWNVPFDITAYGQFSVRVSDSRIFLDKLIGTGKTFTRSSVENTFCGLLMTRIKDYISNVMVHGQRSFLEINSYLTTISESIKQNLSVVLGQYGLQIEEFVAESISVVKDDIYEQIRQSLANRGKQKIEGYSYDKERTFNTLDKQAENQGTSGTMMGAGVGIGAGIAGGQMMGGLMRNTMSAPIAQASSQTTVQPDDDFGRLKPNAALAFQCAQCGKTLQPGWNVCPYCSEPIQRGESS